MLQKCVEIHKRCMILKLMYICCTFTYLFHTHSSIHLMNTKQYSHYQPNSTMLSLPSLLPIPTALALLTWFSPVVLAQNTIVECGPNLVSLAPCGPFVQGLAAVPVQTCCDGLNRLYTQNPTCICLLLHDTSLASSFPINTTLALQLPLLCNLNIEASTCSGTSSPTLPPPSQVSFGARPNSNSTVAASPVVTMAPRPSFMGFGLHQSAQVRLKARGQLLMLLLPAISTALTKYVEP